MTTQHRPVSVTRAGQGASASVAYAGDNWRDDALCAQTDPEVFFLEKGGSPAAAREICAACPVTAACLEAAMTAESGYGRMRRFGIYGGVAPEARWKADVSAQTEAAAGGVAA